MLISHINDPVKSIWPPVQLYDIAYVVVPNAVLATAFARLVIFCPRIAVLGPGREVKDPWTFTFPFTFKLPPTPAPPETTKAPGVELEDPVVP